MPIKSWVKKEIVPFTLRHNKDLDNLKNKFKGICLEFRAIISQVGVCLAHG